MSAQYVAVLIGGRMDGATVMIDDTILRGLLTTPEPPNLNDYLSPDPPEPRRHRWRWDGTVTVEGHYRFRLVGPA